MKTPKALYPSTRMIYHPEVSSCPQCGGPIHLANYLLGDRIIQTLDTVLSIASRPGHCADPTCSAATMQLRSAAKEQLALPYSSYGLDVLVQIGWQRQMQQATFGDIHAALAPTVQISETHVRHLYQHLYLPLLACHEQQHQQRLTHIATQHGGLVIALDGLAPEAGEPQLWCLRELLTGLTLRSGWLARQDQATFEAFLLPLLRLKVPIRAVVSDKQRGLVPAIASVLPTTPHQYCQPHYLRNLVEPLAALDSTLNVTLRTAVRQELGDLLHMQRPPNPETPGLLTMIGLLEESADARASAPQASAAYPDRAATSLDAHATDAKALEADQATRRATDLVTDLVRRTRYLLTLKGRPPLRLAGLEAAAGLEEVAQQSVQMLAHRYDPQLAQLADGISRAVSQVRSTLTELRCGADWLNSIAQTLNPDDKPSRR